MDMLIRAAMLGILVVVVVCIWHIVGMLLGSLLGKLSGQTRRVDAWR